MIESSNANRQAFDERYGTNTAGDIAIGDLTVESPNASHGFKYQAVAPEVMEMAVRELCIDPGEYTFLDLGSGKGRALLIAAILGFRHVVGVEFGKELVTIARANAALMNLRNVEVIHADAANYELPAGNLVVFMANPFGKSVLKEVVRNLGLHKGQRLFVVYVNPRARECLDTAEFLHVFQEIEDLGDDKRSVAIFEKRNDGSASPRRPIFLFQSKIYDDAEVAALRSARITLGHLWPRMAPTSVVQLGCGIGPWLRAAQDLGARDVLGVDSPAGDISRLMVASRCYRPVDIERAFALNRKFDLAICVDVAETLLPERVGALVANLAAHSNCVLFAGAIPFQAGVGHPSDNWPEFWAAEFLKHNLVPIDYLRPLIWGDDNVQWWYRQNLLIYCNPRVALDRFPASSIVQNGLLTRIHPEQYLAAARRGQSEA